MQVISDGIVNGFFKECYGKKGDSFDEFGRASKSFSFKIIDAPKETESFAFILEDKDSIPVCGFAWIHWTGANLKTPFVDENASHSKAAGFIQGTTSWSSKFVGKDRIAVSNYGGMAPPDCPHKYELHVFALDCDLNLEEGFYANDMYWQMQGHTLASAVLSGIYEP